MSNFVRSTHFHTIDSNKIPLTISGIVARDSQKRLQHPYIGRIARGHLCDSTAFLYILFDAAMQCIGQTKDESRTFLKTKRKKHLLGSWVADVQPVMMATSLIHQSCNSLVGYTSSSSAMSPLYGRLDLLSILPV